MPAGHGCMHPSYYIETICNEDIIAQMDNLSIGAHRLLLIMLSRVLKSEDNILPGLVVLDFSDYCKIVGQEIDEKGSRIRDVFL